GQKRPKAPSELFDLVSSIPKSVEHATCEDPGDRPAALTLTPAGPNPDPQFTDGWESALRAAIADPDWPHAQSSNRTAYDEQVDQLSLILDDLPEADPDSQSDATTTTSVSSLVTYATCPKRYFWTDVDRLPRRPAPWLKRGVELHRKIELHNRGVVPLELAEEGAYDFVPDEAEPRTSAFATFESSRFAATKPRWTEAPFVIGNDEGRIRGRIDAVYDEAGAWEVVDFKSGRHRPDPARVVQLQAYAVAVAEGGLGVAAPEDLTVTFAYFGDGLEEVSERVDAPWLGEARANIAEILNGIAAEHYEPAPSEACHHCDFAKFCEPGQAWLRDNP
ncbi:MAG: PD-(D/E)XK nuclease family protein, partial [Acidimicrobiia bacterium]